MSLIAIIVQLRSAIKMLHFTAIISRRESFMNITTAVTDELVDTTMLHISDNIDIDIFKKRYKGHPDRIKSYILMKQKYLYLLWAYRMDKIGKIFKYTTKSWIFELCRYQEFRDVHTIACTT